MIQPVKTKEILSSIRDLWSTLSIQLKLIVVAVAVIVLVCLALFIYAVSAKVFAILSSIVVAVLAVFGIVIKTGPDDVHKELEKQDDEILSMREDRIDEEARKEVIKAKEELAQTETLEEEKQASEDAEIDDMVKNLPADEVKKRIMALATKPEDES